MFLENLLKDQNLVKNFQQKPMKDKHHLKTFFFNLLTSLSYKKLVEQMRLVRFKKRRINPDFHLVGHSAFKFEIKLVFVNFPYTQISIPVSLSLISTSRNGMMSERSSTVNLRLLC